MAPQTPPPISEPCTGYTAVLGCAFIWRDITLASFPQVYWQRFSANRITVLKPSTMQPATGDLAWTHWDSPSSCVTAPSQQLVPNLWKRLMGLDWGLSKTLWSFFLRSEYSSIRTLPGGGKPWILFWLKIKTKAKIHFPIHAVLVEPWVLSN